MSKSWLRRLMDWTDEEPTERIEAEEENIARDRVKLDDKFREAMKAARHVRRAADAFIVAGELLVKDVQGEYHEESTSRDCKSE